MDKKGNIINYPLKGISCAFKGAILLLKTEASIKIQFFIALLVTFAGFYYNISLTEWMLQILAIGLVMSIEGLNTAIEKMADFFHPEHHSKIGFFKDIAAGAVFIASIAAIAVGCLIYFSKVF